MTGLPGGPGRDAATLLAAGVFVGLVLPPPAALSRPLMVPAVVQLPMYALPQG